MRRSTKAPLRQTSYYVSGRIFPEIQWYRNAAILRTASRCSLAILCYTRLRKMMTTTQMATGISRRQMVRPTSALAEMVLLSEIMNTLPLLDPLHVRIANLFADESDILTNDTWNQQYDSVLADARRRLV